MATLVIGGCGFVGSRVVVSLATQGEEVAAFDWDLDSEAIARFPVGTRVIRGDVTELHDVVAALKANPSVNRIVDLAYVMGAEAEANPHVAMRVNALGIVNAFEAARLMDVPRVVFSSSQGVYGPQSAYGDRPVHESDYCSPDQLPLSYCLTKQLNEHLAKKYTERYGLVITALRGTLIHGHGRKRGSTVWASHFASLPAVGKVAYLPFPATDRSCMLYVDDFADQLVTLVLADRPAFTAYNSAGHTVSGTEMAAMVRRFLPDAQIVFDESAPPQSATNMIDSSRYADEFKFRPRSFEQAVYLHIQEARVAGGLSPVARAPESMSARVE